MRPALRLLTSLALCMMSGHVGAAQDLPSTLTFSLSVLSEPVEMILVEGGAFKMGSQRDDPNADNYNPELSTNFSDEGTVHEVTIGSFYMSKYEVTNEMWCDVLGGDIAFGEEQHAKGAVSFSDASYLINNINYLLAANLPEGASFALPTEYQWEYAARGGVNHDAYAYAGSGSAAEVAVFGGVAETPGEVGTLKPNSLGIYDLSGNALEWTQSYYTTDYSAEATTYYSTRVMRGGGIHTRPSRTRDLRVSGRSTARESLSQAYFGLRLVLNLPSVPDLKALKTVTTEADRQARLVRTGGRLAVALPDGTTFDMCGRRL